jgi:replicative DNA helicase
MADSRLEGRVPPHNLNAEKSVLGAMMLEPWAATYTARLTAEDFYYPANGQIFTAMQDLFKANKPVDFMTLHDMLDRRGVLESLGGMDYLIELNNFVPSAVNVEHYVGMVLERSLLRQLIRVSTKMADECYEGSRETQAILQDAEKAIFTLSQRELKRDFTSMATAVKEVYEKAEQMLEHPEIEIGLPTGFPTLDSKIGGMLPSQLILIAARPSMGKSAFVMNVAQFLATYRQKNVVVFSLEMPYDQLAQRILSTGSKVPLSKIKNGGIEPNEWEKLADAVLEIGKTTILVDDTPGISIMEMLSKCRRVSMEHGLDLVVIDYLQLISTTSDGKQRENRQQEISEMTRALKLMARELSVPVLLLSQLSRAAEKRESHRPVLADLRESGAIEQDADIVMFIYRDAYYKKYEGGSEAEIIVAKNRNGATGTATVAWNENIASFQNVDNVHNGY